MPRKPPKSAPRGVQMGVKSAKLASKTGSDSLKILRLGLHDPPKSRPRTSKMPPKAFQMPPKPSKRCPKASKSLPTVQEPPRAPRSHARASKSLQDASKTTVQLTPTTDTRVLTKRLHLARNGGDGLRAQRVLDNILCVAIYGLVGIREA